MSAAENVRSFWVAKARSDSPTTNSRTTRDGPTMEGLRSTLQRTKSWDKAMSLSRTTPPRVLDLPPNKVTNSPFKEQDRALSPTNSPLTTQSRQLPRGSITETSLSPSTPPRSDSPYKSSLSSPEPNKYGSLLRTKSVTFNDLPEVRHMSNCSFESASSPFSTREDAENRSDSEEEYDSDMSMDHIMHENTWANTTPSKKSLPSLEDPFETEQPRALPSVPTSSANSRPLPVLPVQRATSPSEKLMATEQENSRKSFPGLGLQLANHSQVDLSYGEETRSSSWNADEAKIRHDTQSEDEPSLDSDSDADDEAAVSQAVMHNVIGRTRAGLQVGDQSPSFPSPVLRTYSPARSPEPISRELVREKMAQRKAAKENATMKSQSEDALKPHQSLAPPLPHFDSFIKLSPQAATQALKVEDAAAPESPLSDTEFPSRVIPQRKVSDSGRPSTPVEQISQTVPEPQSGRAIHHEREKRLSSDISSQPCPKSPQQVFTAVNYDGDDYDYDEDFDDDLIVHPLPVEFTEHKAKLCHADDMEQDETCQEATQSVAKPSSPDLSGEVEEEGEEEEVLRHLPEIPDIPTRNIDDDVVPLGATSPDLQSFNMKHMSLSLEFDTFGGETLGLEEYMTPEKRPETPITSRTVNHSPTKPNTADSSLDQWAESNSAANTPSLIAPEQATITSRGTKLRTRPSLSPADAAELAARRRKVSSELVSENASLFGSVQSETVTGVDALVDLPGLEDQIESPEDVHEDPIEKIQPKAMPVLQPLTRELSFSDINNAFDRVMQKQKKGYVVRQQAQVVYASANHDEPEPARSESADSMAKKHTRQSSSVYTDISNFSSVSRKNNENISSHRRQNSRIPIGVQMSPKPPAVPEERPLSKLPERLDGGRLFVKVMQVKHLTLPIPKGEDSHFCCTLDNGKHCVTTPWHNLATNVKINQEFELIADHDLEFILTLQAQYVPPVMQTRPRSTLGRLLNSPKRHKQSGSITTMSLSGYVADDGSFARAHLALKHFRDKAFGRPYSMLIPVLNEWAVEPTGVAVKGVPQTRRRKPYKIGEIEVQLLYVPPVTTEHYQNLPTSLSQAVRELRDAEWHNKLHVEGYLSQQGGDCPYWRRRHFKLVGSKLTAYHANTGHIRATINLAKAVEILSDRETLTAPDVTIGRGENKTRRKSGFAEREEGHLYVSEGFRIRFANGEVIEFYADSSAEKAMWMKVLDGLVKKVPVMRDWCKVVLEFENASRG